MTHEQTSQVDLAVVRGAVPAEDADRVARALLSSARNG